MCRKRGKTKGSFGAKVADVGKIVLLRFSRWPSNKDTTSTVLFAGSATHLTVRGQIAGGDRAFLFIPLVVVLFDNFVYFDDFSGLIVI